MELLCCLDLLKWMKERRPLHDPDKLEGRMLERGEISCQEFAESSKEHFQGILLCITLVFTLRSESLLVCQLLLLQISAGWCHKRVDVSEAAQSNFQQFERPFESIVWYVDTMVKVKKWLICLLNMRTAYMDIKDYVYGLNWVEKVFLVMAVQILKKLEFFHLESTNKIDSLNCFNRFLNRLFLDAAECTLS
ncbi:uncharacterized protein LOC118197827 isoform X2 [Stegodyphus dumicola]|uniref:uncharacterized protein LOC118197827 isoform X2 n=1 Tax=Stegodyphus dumicola TaxID=202533 RepID=UPI0015AF002C|nr:uncharacterized protein LOC118197827 isoform X2 [Stegodyphus dumicola]